jgi:hypothetical protein
MFLQKQSHLLSKGTEIIQKTFNNNQLWIVNKKT